MGKNYYIFLMKSGSVRAGTVKDLKQSSIPASRIAYITEEPRYAGELYKLTADSRISGTTFFVVSVNEPHKRYLASLNSTNSGYIVRPIRGNKHGKQENTKSNDNNIQQPTDKKGARDYSQDWVG